MRTYRALCKLISVGRVYLCFGTWASSLSLDGRSAPSLSIRVGRPIIRNSHVLLFPDVPLLCLSKGGAAK